MFPRLLIGGHLLGSLAFCLITLFPPPPPLSRILSALDACDCAPTPTPTPGVDERQQQQQPAPTPLPPPTPFDFDNYGNIPRDDAKARLDNFANALQENRGAQGYIIAYAGRDGRPNEAQRRAEFAREYLVNQRGIEVGRISAVIGGSQEESATQLTVVPPGASPPRPTGTLILTPPATPTPLPNPERQVAFVGRRPAAANPRLSTEEEYLKAAEEALKNLPTGSISFEPERYMTVGVSHDVRASVTRLAKEVVEEALPPKTPVRVYALKVSGKMKVRLTGRADEFKIEPLSSEEQDVIGREYTPWEWRVTPLKEGTYKLELRATVIVKVGAGETVVRDLNAIEREITVKVAPSAASTPTPVPTPAPTPESESLLKWTYKYIVQNVHWTWVFTTLIIPVVIFLRKRYFPDRPAAAAGGGSGGAGRGAGAPDGDGAGRTPEDGEGRQQ